MNRLSQTLLWVCSAIALPYSLTANTPQTTSNDAWRAAKEINQRAEGLVTDADERIDDADNTLYDRNKRRMNYQRARKQECCCQDGQDYYWQHHQPVEFYNYSDGYHGDPDVPEYPPPEL